jgi:hypothetical protein
VLDQPALVELFAPRQHGLTNCDTDGAAKIPGEIDESRRLIGLVRRNAII